MARARQFGSLCSFTWGNPLKRDIGKVPPLKLQKVSKLLFRPSGHSPSTRSAAMRRDMAAARPPPGRCTPSQSPTGPTCSPPILVLAADVEGSREGGATYRDQSATR